MSVYLIPIETAILIFPILAALITIPYVLIQYRRYGAVTPFRVVIVYSFIFYLLCAYFLVIMPLPPIEEVAAYTTPTMQLIPFQCLREFTLTTSLVLNDPSTYWTALNEPSLFLIVFNILLTVPFGVYMRYYFKCSWKKTLLLTFCLTLSFECIQLSALFGIYPRPYRLFDVDDLINNTLGGMLGYALTPLFAHFLPTRDKMDETSYVKGKQVSPLRRISAFFIDLSLLSIVTALILVTLVITNQLKIDSLSMAAIILYASCVCIGIILISIITKGKTPGKALVNIRLIQEDEKPLTWYQHILHYGVIYLLVLPCPYFIFLSLVHYLNMRGYVSFDIVIIAVLTVFYIVSLLQAIRALFHKNHYTWFDRRWKLHDVSTIEHMDLPQSKEQEDEQQEGTKESS